MKIRRGGGEGDMEVVVGMRVKVGVEMVGRCRIGGGGGVIGGWDGRGYDDWVFDGVMFFDGKIIWELGREK